MKKLIIVTDGARLRGFRLNDYQRHGNLSFRCTEIQVLPCEPDLASDGADDEDDLSEQDESSQIRDLAELADQIGTLVMREQAALWNLIAPAQVLPQIRKRLPADAEMKLTRTEAANMIGVSLSEIALRFPPTPYRAASSARPAHSRHGAFAAIARSA